MMGKSHIGHVDWCLLDDWQDKYLLSYEMIWFSKAFCLAGKRSAGAQMSILLL